MTSSWRKILRAFLSFGWPPSTVCWPPVGRAGPSRIVGTGGGCPGSFVLLVTALCHESWTPGRRSGCPPEEFDSKEAET